MRGGHLSRLTRTPVNDSRCSLESCSHDFVQTSQSTAPSVCAITRLAPTVRDVHMVTATHGATQFANRSNHASIHLGAVGSIGYACIGCTCIGFIHLGAVGSTLHRRRAPIMRLHGQPHPTVLPHWHSEMSPVMPSTGTAGNAHVLPEESIILLEAPPFQGAVLSKTTVEMRATVDCMVLIPPP